MRKPVLVFTEVSINDVEFLNTFQIINTGEKLTCSPEIKLYSLIGTEQ